MKLDLIQACSASTTSRSRPAQPTGSGLCHEASHRLTNKYGQPVRSLLGYMSADDFLGGSFRQPVICAVPAHCEFRAHLPAARTAHTDEDLANDNSWRTGSPFINGEAHLSSSDERYQTRTRAMKIRLARLMLVRERADPAAEASA